MAPIGYWGKEPEPERDGGTDPGRFSAFPSRNHIPTQQKQEIASLFLYPQQNSNPTPPPFDSLFT